MNRTILDGDRVRSLRLERGLSQRELARRLRVSSSVVRYLEEGRNHTELSLRFLDELADALAVDPGALVQPRSREANGSSATEDDVRKLGAILAAERTGLTSKALAFATGWKLDRLSKARAALTAQLRPVGMTVACGSGGWKLQPDMTALTWQDELRLGKARQSERGLRLREAELLRAALDGALTPQWEQHIGNADRVALGGLLKSGLVVRHNDGVGLSESASRGLAVPPTSRSVKRTTRGSSRG